MVYVPQRNNDSLWVELVTASAEQFVQMCDLSNKSAGGSDSLEVTEYDLHSMLSIEDTRAAVAEKWAWKRFEFAESARIATQQPEGHLYNVARSYKLLAHKCALLSRGEGFKDISAWKKYWGTMSTVYGTSHYEKKSNNNTFGPVTKVIVTIMRDTVESNVKKLCKETLQWFKGK